MRTYRRNLAETRRYRTRFIIEMRAYNRYTVVGINNALVDLETLFLVTQRL